MLYLYVVPSDNAVKDIDLPDFQGTPEERLRAACIWVANNSPGRQLTLEEIGKIMGLIRSVGPTVWGPTCWEATLWESTLWESREARATDFVRGSAHALGV